MEEQSPLKEEIRISWDPREQEKDRKDQQPRK